MIGHKCVVAESQNDEVMAKSLEALTQDEVRPHQSQPQEEVAKENVEKNKEEEPAKPDSPTQEDQKDEAKDDRKRKTRKETENKDEKKLAPRAKKARSTRPQEEPEYLEEKRNLQDLWKTASPVGFEWELLDSIYEPNWDFKHFEEALEEGGMLYGKKVFVFVNAEPQFVSYKDVIKVILVPIVVAVESPSPPSDKVAIASIQGVMEETVPMKQMKMDWVPYIPLDKRGRQVERMKFQIFILVCRQRRAALKDERAREFLYCLPYFYDPFKEDEVEDSTEVDIIFPSKQLIKRDFDWKFSRLEEFADDLIEEEELSAEQKDEFKEFVKEQVRAAKKARHEAKAARMKAREEVSEEDRKAYESIKFYKFYPKPPPEVSGLGKYPYINRYYRNAHHVF